MTEKFKSEIIELPGSYGNRKVKLSRLFPETPNGVHVLLLHGVHSSANLSSKNKFSHIAQILAERGYTPWLCETSRRSTDKTEFDDELSRVLTLFNGKTFGDESSDCAEALKYVALQNPRELWLWGFSLGGIIAVLLACTGNIPIEKVIVSGSGFSCLPEAAAAMLHLPILSTLFSTIDSSQLDNFRANEIISFHGTEDHIFSEENAIELLEKINLPPEKKRFYSVKDADHSLKVRNGKYDLTIMDEMVDKILSE